MNPTEKKSNMEVSVLPTPTAEMGAESSSIPSVTTFPEPAFESRELQFEQLLL